MYITALVRPYSGGLCDRIMGFSSLLCICHILDRELLIKWDYTDLTSGFTIHPQYDYYQKNITSCGNFEMNSYDIQKFFLENDVTQIWEKYNNIFFWSNQNLLQYFLKNIKYSKLPLFSKYKENYTFLLSKSTRTVLDTIFVLKERVSKTLETFPTFDVGIHIRTHDNVITDADKGKFQENYISSIYKNIQEELKKDSSIFLASDCKFAFSLATFKYTCTDGVSNMIVHSGKSETVDEDGLRRVLCDLYILSRNCRKLYIGWNTNFSRVASMYNLNREIICHETFDPLGLKVVRKPDKVELCNYYSNSGLYRMK